jgi:hypothetical protein
MPRLPFTNTLQLTLKGHAGPTDQPASSLCPKIGITHCACRRLASRHCWPYKAHAGTHARATSSLPQDQHPRHAARRASTAECTPEKRLVSEYQYMTMKN